MWTTYPHKHFLLKWSLSCTSLKTTKLSSRWLIKDEVQQWDTCQEPTELRLIGLLDRINLEPKIQIKYVVTKNQLADMLSKVAAISEFFFLIRSGSSAMSKRGQEATSSEGSPIAKPKPMISAMAKSKPMNLVLHNPLSARKNPPGNRCGSIQPKIQLNVLKWSDRKTLHMQTHGNGETGMDLRTRLAQGNLFVRWTQGQRSTTRGSQNINTWQRFSNVCKRSWESKRVTQHLQWKQYRLMYWSGDCLCFRQWKQPLTLDQITQRIWKFSRTRTSRTFSVYSISRRDWFCKWTEAKVRVYSDSVLCLGKMSHHA